VTAGSIMKIANDLRWMNSGPLAGLAESNCRRRSRQHHAGQVNPVIPRRRW
jgi:fumarate hydratase class II